MKMSYTQGAVHDKNIFWDGLDLVFKEVRNWRWQGLKLNICSAAVKDSGALCCLSAGTTAPAFPRRSH